MPDKTPVKRAYTKKTAPARNGLITGGNFRPVTGFSKLPVIVIVASFAAIGSLMMFRSQAAVAPVSTPEAETFTLPSGASIIDDSNASGGKAVRYLANGAATGQVNLTLAADTVVVRARGIQCKGAPQFQLTIDGTAVATTAVSTTSWTDFTTSKVLASGTHSVSIAHTNYGTSKNCKRTLFIDKLTFLGDDGSSITPPPPTSGLWKPALNSPFMWLLEHPLNINNVSDMGTSATDYLGNPAPDPVVYNIDGFDNPASTVTSLQNQGKKVICYISAGTWENWRSDESSFPESVKGNDVGGWMGERWLDIRQISTLGPIMKSRLDMCKSKGFDAVEFDNVDGYTNNTNFPLTGADQLAYNRFLASEARARGMSAALKNDVDQLADLWQDFDFAINEQCNQYNECDGYKTYFINNNKAVFVIEYEITPGSFCPTMNQQNYIALRMPIDLNGGRTPCR